MIVYFWRIKYCKFGPFKLENLIIRGCKFVFYALQNVTSSYNGLYFMGCCSYQIFIIVDLRLMYVVMLHPCKDLQFSYELQK